VSREGVNRKVFVSTSTFSAFSDSPLRLLRERGFEVVVNPLGRTLSEEETIGFLDGVPYLIAGTERLSAEVLRRCAELRVISRCGVGLDNVDLEVARQLGIVVASTPGAPTEAVAELTVGLILGLLRRIPEADRALRAGRWQKAMGELLRGKALGIVGLGRIGRRVVELIGPFGVRVLAADPCTDTSFAAQHRVTVTNLPGLLREADIVSLHLASSGGVLIGERELGWMKPSAYLLNLARGGVVDEAALARALAEGRLAGAALDVFAEEPYIGPLAGLENVILTPHIGSYARETRIEQEEAAALNLIEAVERLEAGGAPRAGSGR